MKKEKIYWLDKYEGTAEGGIYYRDFDFIEFIKKIQKEKGEVVGIVLDESNNIQLLYDDFKKSDNFQKGVNEQ